MPIISEHTEKLEVDVKLKPDAKDRADDELLKKGLAQEIRRTITRMLDETSTSEDIESISINYTLSDN